MEETITLGIVQKPFGLKGEVLCKSLTSFPEERFKKGRRFFLLNKASGESVEVILRSFRPSGDYFYLSFEGHPSINDVEAYRGYQIEVPLSEAPLPEGYYRFRDLIGLKVIDHETNKELGTVDSVLTYGNKPTLRVQGEEKPFTVPFVFGPFIESIDLEKKECHIHVMEGLL